MPAQTANRNYPYPLGTDPLSVARDVQVLAEAIDLDVDSLLDTQLTTPAADARYVNLTGDTMTGGLNIIDPSGPVLSLRRTAGSATNEPYVEFVGNQASRIGYLQGRGGDMTDSGMRLAADSDRAIRFWVTGGDRVIINPYTNGEAIHVGAQSGEAGFVGFYQAGVRRGYVGQWPPGQMSVAADTGALAVRTVSDQPIQFFVNNSEKGRMLPIGAFLWNKMSTDDMIPGTVIGENAIQQTNNLLNTPCFAANKVGAGNANASDFFHFRRGGTAVGSITSPAAGQTNYNTTSDYRNKEVRGPIKGALDRLMDLHPVRYAGIGNPLELDGFLAHEVSPVVPEAVTGEKDDPDSFQQLDHSRLVPLLVAAVQELNAVVVSLIPARI